MISAGVGIRFSFSLRATVYPGSRRDSFNVTV
jgi:hypothetical protein